MKQISQEQIEKNVAQAFKNFPNAKEVYTTSDGNVFLNENYAKLHAGVEGKVITFQSQEIKDDEKETTKSVTANEVIAAIKEAQSIEDLAPYQNDERKSVKAAFEKRTKELEDIDKGTEVEVTQELLDENPELVEQGVKIGDKITIPNNENN